ncbi:NAD-dependent epimerase/dehydratase family protein [Allorhodopirellula heiligendammensis]|uniref:3 beta-hydroxysteroid dehydrogenase/Delta 5-->4-isomerase n=1 Tax=Allorhodopirellula heiligendammensis TaxID=2714739 RepID=A0A5C6C4K6_9BACT|nr:NAD-dependent epimerase/dehydratase family protein [Allorhodopirellula heiligendammensis]TWU18927.1 3 beta-hydroxysteroid dehydrogenase/Delta 5-->4-isomerase [Allorhodopirellula heiligendammensis]
MRILVTGCSGFLGGEIVRQLLERGDDVVGLSRRETPELVRAGMQHHRGDLTDAAYVHRTITEVDAVIHTAAVAGVWGPWKFFFENNVISTRNVLAACQNSGVTKCVYTSSPSVTFAGGDQSGIDESASYPSRWLCHYPHTKAIAEQEVIAADTAGGLRTLSLRPHLIWGQGDPHLLPRLLDRARAGKLRIIGDGQNRIDTVHVHNAALAHLCAVEALGAAPKSAAGRSYFIAQDEPVPCWPWIARLCETCGAPPPTRHISYRSAYAIGAACEAVYKTLRRKSEPPMTRFVAAQLAKDHYFDITAAKQRLGYEPRVSMDEGLAELARD